MWHAVHFSKRNSLHQSLLFINTCLFTAYTCLFPVSFNTFHISDYVFTSQHYLSNERTHTTIVSVSRIPSTSGLFSAISCKHRHRSHYITAHNTRHYRAFRNVDITIGRKRLNTAELSSVILLESHAV